MKRVTCRVIRLCQLYLCLMLVLFSVPLSADIGNKTSAPPPSGKAGQVLNDDKSLPDGDQPKTGGIKDGSSAKKNAAKKAGTAAAAGVATKKVTSEIIK